MKTILKEIKLYKYGELSKEAKEKANDKYLEFYRHECDFFEDVIKNSLENEGVSGVECIDVEWNLGYSQYDYVKILGNIYFEDLSDELKNKFYKGLSDEELKFFKQFEEYSKICFRELYAGSSCVEIEVRLSATPEELYDLGLDNDFKFEDKEKYYKISPKIDKNIEEWYEEVCEEYKEIGYKYFFEGDEEEIKEYYEAEGQLFLESGEMYEE